MATVESALVVGAVVGGTLGGATGAFRSFWRLRSDPNLAGRARTMAWIGGTFGAIVAAGGVGLVAAALLSPPDISRTQAAIFQGCHQRCVGEGNDASICERHCAYIVRELTATHGPRGLNRLVVAVSRKDPDAVATVTAQARKCADEIGEVLR